MKQINQFTAKRAELHRQLGRRIARTLLSEAYIRGFKDCERGISVTKVPYWSRDLAEAWETGWRDARKERNAR